VDFQGRTSTRSIKEAPSTPSIQGFTIANDNTRLAAKVNLLSIRTGVKGIGERHIVAASFAESLQISPVRCTHLR
jgi:hypothetical protein